MIAADRDIGSAELRSVPCGAVRVPAGCRAVNRATVLALAASMRERGQLQAIGVTPALVLLWGAHRLAAARQLGWKEITAAVHGVKTGSPEAELLEIDENLIREDLSVLERARQTARRKAVYERLQPETRRGISGARARHGSASATVAFAEETAKATGRSRRAVERDAQIGAGLAPAAAAAARGTPLEDHTRTLLALATLPPEQQAAAVKQGETAILRAAQSIRQERAAQNRAGRVGRLAAISAESVELPAGRRWPILLADPPWRYEHSEKPSSAPEAHYPTMALEDICALDVGPCCATSDAVLFLWVPAPLIGQGLRVVTAWGFDYRTHLVWHKPRLGMGYWCRTCHEDLLIATRGAPPTPPVDSRPRSVFEASQGRHSAKPVHVHELIERMYPELSKLELFARARRTGWEAWGNEAVAATQGGA